MIRLFYSNFTEALLDAFAEAIEEEREHPLRELDVVVPNRQLETYVRFGLSQRLGIAAGIRFRRLDELLTRALVGPDSDVRLVDHWTLLAAVLGVLTSPLAHSDPDLASVAGYLEATGEGEGQDLRQVQLAQRITHLFQEYVLHRPEMLQRWRKHGTSEARNSQKPLLDEAERWQRALFLHVNDRLDSSRSDRSGPWLWLDQLVYSAAPITRADHPPLFLFGLSYVAPLYQRMFAHLARNRTLYLFTLNPCCEFWEDVETEGEYRRRLARSKEELRVGSENLAAQEDPFGLFDSEDNPALQRWGIPGRESIRLLNELTDCDFEPRFEIPTGETLLATIQRDILFRVAPRQPEVFPTLDDSLTLYSASDPRREAEEVIASLWNSLRNGSTGGGATPRFDEFAIIVSPAALPTYVRHLEAAALDTGLPLSPTDRPSRSLEDGIDAAKRLLELPFGEFERPEFLKLMTHPALTHREETSREDWSDLAEDLGIVLGRDHQTFQGTYIDRDLLSWDQGIRRLVLGSCLGPDSNNPSPGEAPIFYWQDEEYLPAVAAAPSSPSRLRFGLLARSLIRDASAIQRLEQPLAAWSESFIAMIRRYLVEDGEGTVDTLCRALEPLASMDTQTDRYSGRLATELAKQAIGRITPISGRSLTDGVIVSTFLPMRAIPFRQIYVMGLGESLFPAPQRREALDLRNRRRYSGDVTPTERDRYAFLETVLCARERLCLSWSARHPLTGEAIRPSTVVRDLLEMAQDYLGTSGSEELISYPAFDRSDLASGPETETNADLIGANVWHESVARELGGQLRKQSGVHAPELYMKSLRANPTTEGQERIRQLLCLSRFPESQSSAKDASPDAEQYRLRSRDLADFLRCPLQAWGSVVCRLRRTDDQDLDLRNEEHLVTPPLELVGRRRDAFFLALSERMPPREALESVLHRAELGGRTALGGLLGLEIDRSAALIDTWLSATDEVLGTRSGPWHRVHFGIPPHRTDGDSVYKAIELPLTNASTKAKTQLLLSGTTSFVSRPHQTIVLPFHRTLNRTATLSKLLDVWIDHLVLACLEEPFKSPRRVVVCGPKGSREFCFQPIRSAEALSLLSDLSLNLISSPHDYLLPCDLVFGLLTPGRNAESLTLNEVEGILTAAELQSGLGSCQWGPVPNPNSYPPPTAEHARHWIQRHFGPFFENLSEPSR